MCAARHSIKLLPETLSALAAPTPHAGGTFAEVEAALMVAALRDSKFNQTRPAEAPGISRDNLRYRMKKYGITIPK